MRTMLLYFAAVLGVTVFCWLFEAMGIFLCHGRRHGGHQTDGKTAQHRPK